MQAVSSRFAWGRGFSRAVRATTCVLALLCVAIAAGNARAGTVNLPFTVQDAAGFQWRLYQFGQLQQAGNMPVYSQAAMLYVNGNQASSNARVARVDDKTGEVIIENMNASGLSVTRRVLFDKANSYVRYIDVLKNTTGQPQNVTIMLQTSMNYGINTAETVNDPKKKNQGFAWVAQTSGNAAVMEVYAGKNAKTPMTVNYQPGNSVVAANFAAELKPNQEIALMHLHGVRPTQDAASQFALKIRDADLFKNIPTDLRKLIANFSGSSAFVGDLELLRGDLLDVVELRGGDQLKGTLKEQSFDLTTFYGPVALPVDRVVALLNVGSYRPRQLVVTVDGQIFGGSLKQDVLSLQLSSGQLTKIPLTQISRMGYRKRPGEPEEWTFEKPIVLMRTGERVGVKMPTEPLEIATRYGKLTLQPQQIASIVLQNDEAGVHRVMLQDGSKFSGLLAADSLTMTLDTGDETPQVVKFPVSSISRIQFSPKEVEPGDTTPVVSLVNDDALVGGVTGTLKIDTAFDTITVNAAEIRELKHVAGGGLDVQVTLFDGSSLSGQLQELDLPVSLASGLQMSVPVALLESYNQPQPQPSKDMEEKILGMIKKLSDEDWRVRDRAQQGLVAIGPVAVGALKKLRDGQSPEAQQRIDAILKELEKQRSKPAAESSATETAPQPAVPPKIFINPRR